MRNIEFSKIAAGVMSWGQWGKNQSPEEMSSRIVDYYDLGVTTFDHADIYGGYTTESAFGSAFRFTGLSRESIQLISKCGIKLPLETTPFKVKHYDYSCEAVIQSVENSLNNLRTDYLDLLLVHRPSPLLDVDELAGVIDDLIQAGKIRAFGVSNFLSPGLSLLQSEIEIAANQIECSLTHYEPMFDGTLDFHIQNKLITMAWKPLGDIFDLENERSARLKPELDSLAGKYDCTPAQLAVAWLCQHPAKIVPVMGTTNPDRMQQAVTATEMKLDVEDWFRLLELSQGHEVP